ncbi:MAG: 3-keto-5-aminohexanoate cleavage protein, partial [Pseudomonadales bacterium]
MGIPWGAPDDLNTLMAMVNNVPSGWLYSAFSIGKNQMPYVGAAVLAGANVRVGLEDNLWLERGVLANNAQLVEKACGIIDAMGVAIMTPEEVRQELGLIKRDPPG